MCHLAIPALYNLLMTQSKSNARLSYRTQYAVVSQREQWEDALSSEHFAQALESDILCFVGTECYIERVASHYMLCDESRL